MGDGHVDTMPGIRVPMHTCCTAQCVAMHAGVARRFRIPGDNATQPWVLIMDDDILPSQEALDQLIRAFAENPNRIVGKWGRMRCVSHLHLHAKCLHEQGWAGQFTGPCHAVRRRARCACLVCHIPATVVILVVCGFAARVPIAHLCT